MQWLARVCVRRPVFTWVLVLALVVVGGVSITGLGVDRFPDVDFPMVVVTTVLPGASPEQVEREVSDRLEEQLNSISGLEELRSSSFEGLSVVMARFDLGKDTAEAAQEVRDRVNRAIPQLPPDIEQPRVERMDPDAAPVMLVALESTRSARETTEFASRKVRRRLESLDGVGGVTVLGGRERRIDVHVDPVRLERYGLTVSDVQRALGTQNVDVPGGQVNEGRRTVGLRVRGRAPDVASLAEIAVARRAGNVIRVRDVGEVVDAEADASSSASLNGQDVVILAIRKQSGTNTVAVIDALRERVDELQAELPGAYRLRIVRDESEFIRNAIHAVVEHLVLGGLLAALVVLVFLWNGRATVISALAIPTSIIATFGLIQAMGLTLNTITLLALTLAVGIVIDDAIVVLENIFRFIEEKRLPTRQAAVEATKEIGLAVLATTLSLIAVFLPVAFMGGIVGRFMASFGYTMSFAIAVSLLVSFTLTPMLAARWLRGPKAPRRNALDDAKGAGGSHDVQPPHVHDDPLEHVDPAPGPRAEERAEYLEWMRGTRTPPALGGAHHASRGIYGLIERAYGKMLAFSMRHRWIVAVAIVASLAGVVPLGAAVQKNFLPLDDESRFEITVRAPEGTSLGETRILAERIARATRGLPGVGYTVSTVGSAPGDSSGRGPNQASIFVALVPPDQRQLDQQQLVAKVRTDVLPRFERYGLRTIVSPVNVFGGGGADSATIQYVLRGPELDRLSDYSQRLLAKVRTIPGVVDADTTLVVGKPEYVVTVDRARAADLDVSVADVANALRMLVGGARVGTYEERGEQYEIQLRATEAARLDPETIARVTVPAGMTGRSVRLGDVVSIRESTGPSSIQRMARERQVTIYANVLPGTSEAAVIAKFHEARESLRMAPGYQADLVGRSKELGNAAKSFALAFFLSFAFMYLVLAAQFESWIHPVTILVSLPLTVPFALLSLVVLGQSLNIFSTLGILVLFGVVKKNSILQVDHIRALRRKGLSRADAVMVGNRDRLRPILMTTIAFVAGMVPLVLSSGAGAGTNRAMGSVIIGGQTLSLLLTLIATPVVYSWFDDLSHSRAVRLAKRIVSWPFRRLAGLFGKGHEDVGEPEPAE
ncbi:MAG: efflux RND transporter permease subunit [Deltaproteobacteria bacterium]|nr:efflux RND transporter permease subunit [Deltaproteobacteria bacterium]